MSTSLEHFQNLIKSVTDSIAGLPLDKDLEAKLNDTFPPSSEIFKSIAAACHEGRKNGDMCQHEAGGIEYGRVIKANDELANFSVDLVRMNNIVGPHHRHPEGEIDMIMPITEGAKFDGHGAGWLVYEADSAHKPTVSEGDALVLYLLPNGAIDFSRN